MDINIENAPVIPKPVKPFVYTGNYEQDKKGIALHNLFEYANGDP